MIIRQWKVDDNDKIEVIENYSFKTPWTRAMLDSLFLASDFFGLVAESDGDIVGYIGVAVGIWDCDIMNVAVAKENRRQGIAEKLMREFLSFAKKLGKEKVFLEVRRSNLPAQNLYYKVGFKKVGERAKYYENTEDAFILALELEECAY